MTIFGTIILGIVEGITEFLPISSTAHLEIVSRVMGLVENDFLKTFSIVIQFGAILAVVIIYFPTLKKSKYIWKKILAAFLPTAIIGFVLYKLIKSVLLGNLLVVALALLIGGVIIILFEKYFGKHESKEESNTDAVTEIQNLSYGKSFLIGLAQAVAVIPGVSRSAATILAGRGMGLTKKAILDFSFLLAIPTMFVASVYDLYKNAGSFSLGDFRYLILGFIVSFIFAYISLKWLLKFVRTHDFRIFGYYRVLIAVVLILFLYS